MKTVKTNVVRGELTLNSGIILRLISWGKEVMSSNRMGAKVVGVRPEWITTRVELVHPGRVREWGETDSIVLLHLNSADNDEDNSGLGTGARLCPDWAVEAVEALRVAFAMSETDYERFYNAIMQTREAVAANPTKE